MSFDARAFFERFIAALNARDFATVEQMTHPEFIGDSPQSGERSRGYKSWEIQLSQYPGADDIVTEVADSGIIGGDERWAISPAYTVVPLASSNEYTTLLRARYPDGSWWRIVSHVELRDEKLYRMESFYAPELPAPLAESIAKFAHG